MCRERFTSSYTVLVVGGRHKAVSGALLRPALALLHACFIFRQVPSADPGKPCSAMKALQKRHLIQLFCAVAVGVFIGKFNAEVRCHML